VKLLTKHSSSFSVITILHLLLLDKFVVAVIKNCGIYLIPAHIRVSSPCSGFLMEILEVDRVAFGRLGEWENYWYCLTFKLFLLCIRNKIIRIIKSQKQQKFMEFSEDCFQISLK
jgi:hypothetical protein